MDETSRDEYPLESVRGVKLVIVGSTGSCVYIDIEGRGIVEVWESKLTITEIDMKHDVSDPRIVVKVRNDTYVEIFATEAQVKKILEVFGYAPLLS